MNRAFSALLALLVLAGCDYKVRYELFNDDVEPVHLMVNGEGSPGATKVEPGELRIFVDKYEEPGTYYTQVVARRNDFTIDVADCTLVWDPSSEEKPMLVAYAEFSSAGLSPCTVTPAD